MSLMTAQRDTRIRHLLAALSVHVSLLVLLVSPCLAQQVEPVPGDLEGVGITQKLDEQVPLDLQFRDENGRIVELGQYFRQDRPVLLSLVYYNCPMLCNLVLEGLLDVLEDLEWLPGREFEIVTVSIDPHEKPELAQMKKRNYLKSYGRPEAGAGWHFLTGEPDSIRTLADSVGFRYRYLPETGEFAHSAAVIVLTPTGKVSRYLFGVRHDPKTLRLSLVEAADGKIGSPIDQFLLYCYRYDAQEGRYAPVAMRLMRLGGGLTALILGVVLAGLWRRDNRKRHDR
jgi:protein SCO1/2